MDVASGGSPQPHCPYPGCGAAVRPKSKFCSRCSGILVFVCPCPEPARVSADCRACDECGTNWWNEGLKRIREKQEESDSLAPPMSSLGLSSANSSFSLIQDSRLPLSSISEARDANGNPEPAPLMVSSLYPNIGKPSTGSGDDRNGNVGRPAQEPEEVPTPNSQFAEPKSPAKVIVSESPPPGFEHVTRQILAPDDEVARGTTVAVSGSPPPGFEKVTHEALAKKDSDGSDDWVTLDGDTTAETTFPAEPDVEPVTTTGPGPMDTSEVPTPPTEDKPPEPADSPKLNRHPKARKEKASGSAEETLIPPEELESEEGRRGPTTLAAQAAIERPAGVKDPLANTAGGEPQSFFGNSKSDAWEKESSGSLFGSSGPPAERRPAPVLPPKPKLPEKASYAKATMASQSKSVHIRLEAPVSVRFVVFVPDDVLRPEDGEIGIRFHSMLMKGIGTSTRMNFVATVGSKEESFHMYSRTVDIPTALARGLPNQDRRYKYVYRIKGDPENNIVWEHLHGPSKSGDIAAHRALNIPGHAVISKRYTVLDGYFEVREPPNLDKSSSWRSKIKSVFSGKAALKPVFERGLAFNRSIFQLLLPRVGRRGFYLQLNPATGMVGEFPLQFTDALNYIDSVFHQFKNRFYREKESLAHDYFNQLFLEYVEDCEAALVRLSAESWGPKTLTCLTLVTSLSVYPPGEHEIRAVILRLLSFAAIPTAASPDSLAALVSELGGLDQSRILQNMPTRLIPESEEMQGLKALLCLTATRIMNADEAVMALLSLIPLYHIATTTSTSPRPASLLMLEFWRVPSENWRHSGSRKVGEQPVEWMRKMQALDPFFARSVLFIFFRYETKLPANMLSVAPLECMAWLARQLTQRYDSSSNYEKETQAKAVLDIVGTLETAIGSLESVAMTQEEGEDTLSQWCFVMEKYLSSRTRYAFRLDVGGAQAILKSTLLILDRIGAIPGFASVVANPNLGRIFGDLLRAANDIFHKAGIQPLLQLMTVQTQATDGGLQDTWRKWLLEQFSKSRKQANSDQALAELDELSNCSNLPPFFKEAMDSRLTEILNAIISEAKNSAEGWRLMTSKVSPATLSLHLSRLVYRRWPPDDDAGAIVNHLLTSPTISGIIGYGLDVVELDEPSQALITKGLSLLQLRVDQVRDGSATVEEAEYLRKHSRVVVQLKMTSDDFFGALKQLLGHRHSLIAKAQLLDGCFPTNLGIRLKNLVYLRAIITKEAAIKLSHIGSLRLVDGKRWEFEPQLYDFTAAMDVPLARLQELRGNNVFQLIWREQLQNWPGPEATAEGGDPTGTGKEATLAMLVPKFLKPAEAKAKGLCLPLLSGHTTVGTLLGLLRRLPHGFLESEDFVRDFEVLAQGVGPEWTEKEKRQETLQTRQRQMLAFAQLQASSSVISEMHKTATTLSFRTATSQIAEIMKNTGDEGEDTELGSVDLEKATQMGTTLAFVSDPALLARALGAFRKALPLVQWLKDTFASDGKVSERNVTTFVELADSGDDEEKSSLLRDFGASAETFGALIYDLPKDPSFEETAIIFQRLIEALKKRENATAKLVKVCDELETLSGLWDAALSMETSKIDQLKAIVQSGIFVLDASAATSPRHNAHDDEDEAKDEANKLLSLRYISGKTKSASGREHPKWTTMSIGKVKELHSNLILISAQMKDGATKGAIHDFSKVLDCVLRFGSLFREHWEGGNLFFASIRVEFFLDPTLEVKSTVIFHSGQETGQLLRGTQPTLQEELDCLCDFLQASRESWGAFIAKMRRNHPHLDHFTNRQVLKLREMLADFRRSAQTDLCTELEMLLMVLKKDVAATDVVHAIEEAERRLDEQDDDDTPTEETKSRKEILLRELVEYNYSLEDAARALAASPDNADFDDLLEWLKTHKDELKKAPKPEAEKAGSDPSVKEELRLLVAKVQAESRNKPLSTQLDYMFGEYLDNQSQDRRLAEYIGIGELGRILSSVGEEELGEEEPIRLVMPSWVEAGRPNLVVVPEVDILRYVYSLYFETPQSRFDFSRVFLCTPQTTEEELRLFVARIRHSRRPQLYSILFVEALDSQLSQSLELELRQLVDGAISRYFGLIVFASAEHYETCHLAGLLTRYLRSGADEKWALSPHKCWLKVSEQLVKDPNAAPGPLGAIKRLRSVLVTSVGYGQGKSLCVQRMSAGAAVFKIPIHERLLDTSQLWTRLKERVGDGRRPKVVHLDISDHRTRGVDKLVFQLMLLGGFTTPEGKVWRLRPSESFVFEMTSAANGTLSLSNGQDGQAERLFAKEFRFCLPTIQCHSPAYTSGILHQKLTPNLQLMHRLLDEDFKPQIHHDGGAESRSLSIQRCVAFLAPNAGQLTEPQRLDLLLKKCGKTGSEQDAAGVKAPSWLELWNFVRFLSAQLKACEENSICQSGVLPGFLEFVVHFSVKMARDFATRSLHISEEVTSLESGDAGLLGRLDQYSVKRNWEQNPHPYLFFNPDLQTFSFFGCILRPIPNPQNPRMYDRVDLMDPKTNAILEPGIISPMLFLQLQTQLQGDPHFAQDLSRPFDNCSRQEKLRKLYQVLVPEAYRFLETHAGGFPDPDPNFEITMDCALKMLAIDMRFRCGIPVVVMGETGCGKTRLIEFYSSVKRLCHPTVCNFLILRVHGGTDSQRLQDEVTKATAAAARNFTDFKMETVLFLDEANTTREMSLVKELVLDRSFNGIPVKAEHLHFALALNPYKRHDDKAIRKLENAGLGYHVQDLELLQRFDDGSVPMRQLVYRVNPLPPSLVPLAWDFGHLSADTEDLYIRQMLKRSIIGFRDDGVQVSQQEEEVLCNVLCAAQHFMKRQDGESSFVSLRDIERTLKALRWFIGKDDLFFGEDEQFADMGPLSRSVVLAVVTCYRMSLQEAREALDKVLAKEFKAPLVLPDGAATIGAVFDFVSSELLADAVQTQHRVAHNEALRENVFMIVVTSQLNIPLFLVGKPGSSKSLGKTIVADNMKGPKSEGRIFTELKAVKMLSYQCSPLATAKGVADVFRDAATQQRLELEAGKSLDDFAVLPVFDEIGMAEDSPKLPLKALHGLLEEGSAGLDGIPVQAWHRTGFVGISNWALDPAKMNRGIFLSRSLPTKRQLIETAECICDVHSPNFSKIVKFIDPLTTAYLEIYNTQDADYEFYGLRDFYAMMKQLAELGTTVRLPTVYPEDIVRVIQHNFSGQKALPAFTVFANHLRPLQSPDAFPLVPKIPVQQLIQENIRGSNEAGKLNRYLLLLTHNDAALRMVKGIKELASAEVIFGSRFPQDLEYTQICRNINRIRLCMEQGRPVVLLNLESLYESLYDLLNQAFVEVRGEFVVDIGLGTHRHRTRVNPEFRLVVLAEYDEVRRCFPAALVNRLEKHTVFLYSDMAPHDVELADNLSRWATAVSRPTEPRRGIPGQRQTYEAEDVFIGFSEDTPFSLVADRREMSKTFSEDDDKTWLRRTLVQTCVPEGILRIRESQMGCIDKDGQETDWALGVYFGNAAHSSLGHLFAEWLEEPTAKMLQITTYQAQIISTEDADTLAAVARRHDVGRLLVWQLQDFATELQFESALRDVFSSNERCVVLVQCIAAQQHPKLVASCRHKLEEVRAEWPNSPVYVGLILMLHRLPFHLTDRVAKWAESSHDQFLHVKHEKPISGPAALDALANAAQVDPKAHVHLVEEREKSLDTTVRKAIGLGKEARQLVIIQFFHHERRKPSKIAGEVRSKLTRVLEKAGAAGKNVKVVLLTTIPKTSSFPGRHWRSWHLDALVPDALALPSVDALLSTTPSQLLSPDSHLFDSRGFIKSCVADAAARIKDESSRKSARSSLFAEIIVKHETFSAEVERRVAALMAEKEGDMLARSVQDWVYEQAKDARSVVDNRTFSRALLKRLEDLVAPMLAGLLCCIDSFDNLRLLGDKVNDWEGRIWLLLFKDEALLSDLHLKSPMFQSQGDYRDMKTEFVPQSTEGWSVEFPFSWLLTERLTALVQRQSERRAELAESGVELQDSEILQRLQAQLTELSWGAVVNNSSLRRPKDVLKSYNHDLVYLRFPAVANHPTIAVVIMETIGMSAWKLFESAAGKLNPLICVHVAAHKLNEALLRYQVEGKLKMEPIHNDHFETLSLGFPELSEQLKPGVLSGKGRPDVALAEVVMEILASAFLPGDELDKLKATKPHLLVG